MTWLVSHGNEALSSLRVGELGEQLAGPRPGEHEAAARGRDVAQADRAVGRQQALEVVAVVALGGAGADDVVVVLAKLGDRELGADAAALGQCVAQRDPPGLGRHLVGDQVVEPGLGARAGDLVLGERRQVDDADLLAHQPHLVADVLEVVRAPEAPHVLALDARRREPVGALPAVALAEHRAHPRQLVVDRARLGGARVRALLVGEMDREDVAVGLLVLLHHVALGGVRTEAARVHREHVDARLALDDPLRQLPARAAGRRDAEAVALVEPQVAHVPGGADQRAAVRRVGDRSVDDILDAAVLECRDTALRRLDVRQQPLEVALEQALAEPVGNAVGKARRRAGLVGPEDPAEALLAQVVGLVGLAQHRELAPAALPVGLQLRRLVIDDVLVLDRDRRHVDTEHAAGLAGVVAGGDRRRARR